MNAPPLSQILSIMLHSNNLINMNHLQTNNLKTGILKTRKNPTTKATLNTIRLYYNQSALNHFLPTPLLRRSVLEATVHLNFLGFLPNLSILFSHLPEQKLTDLPVFLTKTFPVPGGISCPQNPHFILLAPLSQCTSLNLSFPKHQKMTNINRTLHITPQNLSLIPALKNLTPDKSCITPRPSPTKNLLNPRRNRLSKNNRTLLLLLRLSLLLNLNSLTHHLLKRDR